MAKAREGIKNMVGVGPVVGAKPYGSIANKKSAKGKGIANEEIPHHYFTITNIEGASTAAPPFCSCRNS